MAELAARYLDAMAVTPLIRRRGRIQDFNGLVLEASGPDVSLGELCRVHPGGDREAVAAEVVGFRGGRVLLMPYGKVNGVSLESEVEATGHALSIPVGEGLLGRVVDAFSDPLDDGPPLRLDEHSPLHRRPINPMHRAPVDQILETGVAAVDGLLTLGKGQRVGVFAGSGVGKSTLLGMLTRHVSADIHVIALVGERGREVWDFIRESLPPAILERSVVVVATADQPALVRCHAVHAATAIAEYFRDRGDDVLLVMDSVTRFAMALREVGLAVGEPATARGYTPSVFAALPPVLERAGRLAGAGSITGIYSVLVEGDDMQDPVADHMRALLDGHIILSRDMAARGHYPAVDILQSVSRLMAKLVDGEDHSLAQRCRELLATLDASRDLVDMGAYRRGSNPALDEAIRLAPRIEAVLGQGAAERSTRAETLTALRQAVTA